MPPEAEEIWKYIIAKGGQGACVKKRPFVAFYPETWSLGNTWKYIISKGVRGFIPEAEVFFVNLDVQRRKFVTFYLEWGYLTKIWKHIIAKGVRRLAP